MKTTALFSLLGLAAAAPRGQKLTQRPASARIQRSQFNNNPTNTTSQATYSSNWSGAVQHGNGFNHVQGTITVPRASGGAGAAASAWVGIDGDNCQSALLQTGISFYGDGSFEAWFEWIPDYSHAFQGFDVSVGDQIKMSVDASNTTSGVAVLENLTTGNKVQHQFDSPPSTLCETDAEWIVEDFKSDGSPIPFANFDSVTFTDASASGDSGTVTPNGATVIDLRDKNSGEVLSTCSTSGDDVTCNYTGGN